MAQTARPGDESTTGLAQGGKLHDRQVHRRDCPGANRRRDITPETKQRIRELYAETGNGHEVARRLGIGRTTVYKYLGLQKCRHPTWTDDEIQVLVDGYLEKLPAQEIARKTGRTTRAVMVRMCRYRKQVRSDPKKRRVMGVMTYVLKVMRKADIFREVEQ